MHLLAVARVSSENNLTAALLWSNRELLDAGTDKRNICRDEDGKFKKSINISRPLQQTFE